MNQCSGTGLLTVTTLLSFVISGHSAGLDERCWNLAAKENVTHEASPLNGVVVSYVSYLWCKDNCQGWAPYTSSDFVLLLTGFALPAIIFSTIIPRRWRLDLPELMFKIRPDRILTFLKIVFSLPAICVVAALDMILWITCIMTFAGPMLFSGVQEMLLDYRVVTHLEKNVGMPAGEKLEAVVALLCGNFDQEPDDPTTRIHKALIPSILTGPLLERTKSRLVTIMNAQTSFGTTIGVPAAFFVGGYLYNVAGTLPSGTISFAVFWMVLVNIAIISGTLLAGNNPSVVSVLLVTNHVRRPRTRLALLKDIYDSELYPVSMWDRGVTKYKWLRNTTAWQNPQGARQSLFRNSIEIGPWGWVTITTSTVLLIAAPCMLSWSDDYFIPFPWLGCLSLLYVIYLGTQIWLTLAALVLSYWKLPFHDVWRPWQSLFKKVPRSYYWRACLLIFTSISGAAAFVAANITVFGTIFQFFGIFNNCFCGRPVSTWWGPPSESPVFFQSYFTPAYNNYINEVATGLVWSAASFTCFVCFIGWWYQRALRYTLREIIESI